MSNPIVDFFRNLGQQRVDAAVNSVNAKKMGAIAKAKSGAAKEFNKAINAPVKAAKDAAGGAKKAVADKAKDKPKEGGDMGWFGRKKAEPVDEPAEEYGGGEKTVAINLNDINRSTFKPVVGWVVVLSGELRGRDFRLVDGKNTMGTAADCDVVLTDPYLSSKHSVIRHENGTFTVSDLDSTNGTFVNDRRISRMDIIDNDKIRLGRTELKFKSLE
ncbi:MAG: FHA domain-containing protein [Deltaproteobacteria bacterium]|nr:FHA domain-containing protein [Deltaproteobacteria bacterium]